MTAPSQWAVFSSYSSPSTPASGIDVGVTFAKNIWLSIGYNFAGFDDKDFSAGNYTAQGPFITIRMKVDQDTVRELATGGHLPGQGNHD